MSVRLSDTIIAGGADAFMTVRHLRIAGSNAEIGGALANLARTELGVRKTPWTDPLTTRAQRTFMQRNWPALHARMGGVAEGFGASLADDSLEFSFLAYDTGVPGCSCVFYPGGTTASGHNVVARNFDYTTGSHADLPLGGGALSHLAERDASTSRPFCGRPFLIELHPDTGYATLGMCAFDLLGQLTDGVNSEGLCVALLNDNETPAGPYFQPFGTAGAGLSEGQIPRFLLENCATTEDAKVALLSTKQYYVAGPCHYLIGDRHGNGFVWEYSSIRNTHHIVERAGAPLPVTNHLLHPHTQAVPSEVLENSQRRLAMLEARLAQRRGPLTNDAIRDINSCVQALEATGAGQYTNAVKPGRTLWYAHYDLDRRSVEIDFYLGDIDGRVTRSPARRFQLEA